MQNRAYAWIVKNICRGISAGLCLLSLAGCGRPAEPSVSAGSTAGQPAPAPTADGPQTVIQIHALGTSFFTDAQVDRINAHLLRLGRSYRIAVQTPGTTYMDEHRNQNPPSSWILDYLSAAKANKAAVDLIDIHQTIATLPTATQLVDLGFVTPISDFFETADGAAVRAAYPPPVWESMQIRGTDYLFPGKCQFGIHVPGSLRVNRALAEKYGLSVENWSYDLWAHEPELTAVWEGEKDTPNFILFPAYEMIHSLPHITPVESVSHVCSPFVYNEKTGRIESVFEQADYRKALAFAQKWSAEQKIYSRNIRPDLPPTTFIQTDSAFLPPADPAEWITLDAGSRPLSRIVYSGWAVTAWSPHREAVYDLMTLVCTDPEVNRLIFEDEAHPGPVYGTAWGNPWLYHAHADHPEQLKWTYASQPTESAAAVFDAWPRSGIYGKTFETAAVVQEMNAIADQLALDLLTNINYDTIDADALQKKTEALGLKTVIDHLNRQLADDAAPAGGAAERQADKPSDGPAADDADNG